MLKIIKLHPKRKGKRVKARRATKGGYLRPNMCLHKFCNSSFCRSFIFAFGLLSVFLAVVSHLFWNEIWKHVIEKELELSESSKSFDVWIENPIPLFIDFYFFNWTNPTDLEIPGYKPKFTQAGPYRFREEVRKIDVTWNENKTVTYRKLRRWYSQPEESTGSLNDVITSLNVIALVGENSEFHGSDRNGSVIHSFFQTAAHSTKYWNKLARIPLSVVLSSTQKIDTSKQVRELLFEGFDDPLIEFASKIPGLSSQVPFDRFGWFYKRNGSSEFDGVFNVETGAKGMDGLGKLLSWNFKNHTSFYEGPCGEVKGSAGDFWPPERAKMDKITLFSPDMCRYINFNFNGEETVQGLKGYRYDSGPSLFDNGTADSENKCFCGERCHSAGVLNVSKCRSGAPAFVSYPHFHMADPFYVTSVEGLKPESGKHDTYIILEKEEKNPFQIYAIYMRISNTHCCSFLQPQFFNPALSCNYITMLDGVPTIFFPIMWFEQRVTIPEHLKQEIEVLLELPRFGFIISAVLYTAGFSCLIIFALSRCVRCKEQT